MPTIEKLIGVLLPLLPDAEITMDNNGQVVIYTGVMASGGPFDPPSVRDRGRYLLPCMSLPGYCLGRGLDTEEVLEVLRNSEISFVTNDDTLVREDRLCRMLGIEPSEAEHWMIRLGC